MKKLLLIILFAIPALACSPSADPAAVIGIAPKAAPIPPPAPRYYEAQVTADVLHLRIAPDGDILAWLFAGDSVEVYSNEWLDGTEWCNVDTAQGWGWVACRYLEAE